jgi:hypothetical protein
MLHFGQKLKAAKARKEKEIMNHLKKFESFLITKPVRKFMPFWSDEDIALQVLKELKEMKNKHDSQA